MEIGSENRPETIQITVSLEGLFDNNPIPTVPPGYRIRRRLTADERMVYNNFMALLGEYLGKEITLHKDRIYRNSDRYEAWVYGKEGRRMYVSRHYGDPRINYTMSYCPKHITAFNAHTMGHKDIAFGWTYGKTEERDIMELIREYHGYGNGSYYLYSVSQRVVFRREDD